MKRFRLTILTVIFCGILSDSSALSQDDSSQKIITADNVQQLTEIAVLGRGIINDVKWSPDGRTLAASTTVGIWLFEANSPFELDEALEPQLLGGGGEIIFSPDSRLLISGSSGLVNVWDLASRARRFTGALEEQKFYFALSGDSKRLAATSYQYETESPVIIWSLETDQFATVARLPAHDPRIVALALNSDGSLLAMADASGTVHLVELPSGNEISTAETTYMAFHGAILTFSADDRRLLAHIMDVSANGVPLDGIYLWDVEALRSGADSSALLYAIDTRNVRSEPVFSHDQTLLALHAGLDFIVLLDTESGEERGRFRSSTAPCHLAFSDDDRQVTATDACNGTFWIWNVSQALDYGSARVTLPMAIEPDLDAARVWIPNLSLPASAFDGQSPILNGHQQPVSAVFFSPDSRQVISHAADGTTRVWSTISYEQVSRIAHETGSGSVSAFSPEDGIIANVPWSAVIELWVINSGQRVRTLEGHTGRINAVAFSPNGARLASGSARLYAEEENPDTTLRLWNTQTGKGRILQRDEFYVKALAFSPDGRWLVSGGDAPDRANLRFWDAETGEFQQALGDYAVVTGLVFNPDGRWLAVSSERTTIDLWDINAGEPHLTRTLPADNDNRFKWLAFSPDGTLVVAGGGQRAAVWNMTSGELLTAFDLPGGITSLAIAPDGRLIAFGLNDGTIRLWGVTQ